MTYEVIFEPVPAGNDAEFNVFPNEDAVKMYFERQTYEIKCGTVVVKFSPAATPKARSRNDFTTLSKTVMSLPRQARKCKLLVLLP